MPHRTHGRVFRQINLARRRLASETGLPFSQLLDNELVERALAEDNVSFRDRLYTPCITLWIFLSQVLDPMQCCLQAVLRFLAHRLAQGAGPCSSETSAYCQARQRLPEGVVKRLMMATGQQLHQREMPDAWRWKGRGVKLADGTTVSMPDTPENQREYPQIRRQKPGVGFPLARMVVLFSLAVGTVLEAAIGPYRGKETGEISLLRTLYDSFEPDDVLLGDRIYCTYFDIVMLQQRGVDVVVRLHQRRCADFRRGRRLGRDDHLITWRKPRSCPRWMDKATFQSLPDELTVREVRVRVNIPGFRTDSLVVVTTLLDAEEYSASDLAELYRARWQAELDLRALKQTLQMDVLRCQTPTMVRKEIWVHLLAYNLIRRVMADAAEKHGILPHELSFKSALEALLAFSTYMANMPPAQAEVYYAHLLDALARHRVGDRPDRCEPRVKKRRPKPYPTMQEPRPAVRKRYVKRRNG
jgi:hypothetical protein